MSNSTVPAQALPTSHRTCASSEPPDTASVELKIAIDDVEGRESDTGAVAAVDEMLAADVAPDIVADPPVVTCVIRRVGIGMPALTALFLRRCCSP
jgi:hypothetical protein